MTWNALEHKLQCICRNLDRQLIIGNSFYVPANTISLSTVFLKFSLQDQALILSILITILILYIFICLWARNQDKKDVAKVSEDYLAFWKNFFYISICSVYLHTFNQDRRTLI